MPRAADAIHDDGGSVKIGATGTIGTLMTRELESPKHSEQTSSTRRKQQTVPVSIPCGANPRREHYKGETKQMNMAVSEEVAVVAILNKHIVQIMHDEMDTELQC